MTTRLTIATLIALAVAPAFAGDCRYGLRAAGTPLPLSFGGQAWLVVISHFRAHIERYPQDVLYEISCRIASNPMQGALGAGAGAISGLVSADLASAAAPL